jgi:hypothetical protein
VRGRCNRKAARLAQGIPSNFTAEVVFADTASKRAGKGAFEAWVEAARQLLRPKATDAAEEKRKRRSVA